MMTRSHLPQTYIDASLSLGLGGRRHHRRDRAAAYWACVALVAMTLFAIALGAARGPVYRPFISIAATVWSLADLMTAMLLISQFRVNGRLFLTVIASAYLIISGLTTWAYIVELPGINGFVTTSIADQQLSVGFGQSGMRPSRSWSSSQPFSIPIYASARIQIGRSVARFGPPSCSRSLLPP